MRHRTFIANDMDLESIIPLKPILSLINWANMGSESSHILDSDLDIISPIDVEEGGVPECRKLSFVNRLRLQFFGKVCVGEISLDGWHESLPLYAFKCSIHGVQFNYPSGWKRILKCPQCFSQDASI